jgi:hypothetical protein
LLGTEEGVYIAELAKDGGYSVHQYLFKPNLLPCQFILSKTMVIRLLYVTVCIFSKDFEETICRMFALECPGVY